MFKLVNIMLVSLLTACSVFLSPLEEASAKYKNNRDYESLQIIHEHLAFGIERKAIENLLGEPDYSPTDGLYYYSSSQRVFIENQNRYTSPGLIVDYRDKKGVTTETLRKFQLRNIGE
ncbi:MAG: hypothetical protein GXP18_06440 [Gammaproteobacteria bacterium]|nr:hypothetical protein [Gammaproteobacteria bacterium]